MNSSPANEETKKERKRFLINLLHNLSFNLKAYLVSRNTLPIANGWEWWRIRVSLRNAHAQTDRVQRRKWLRLRFRGRTWGMKRYGRVPMLLACGVIICEEQNKESIEHSERANESVNLMKIDSKAELMSVALTYAQTNDTMILYAMKIIYF